MKSAKGAQARRPRVLIDLWAQCWASVFKVMRRQDRLGEGGGEMRCVQPVMGEAVGGGNPQTLFWCPAPLQGFPWWPDGKESVCSAEEGWILGSGRSPGEGNDNPLQYSCLENSWTEGPGGL